MRNELLDLGLRAARRAGLVALVESEALSLNKHTQIELGATSNDKEAPGAENPYV